MQEYHVFREPAIKHSETDMPIQTDSIQISAWLNDLNSSKPEVRHYRVVKYSQVIAWMLVVMESESNSEPFLASCEAYLISSKFISKSNAFVL
jgi:hypothetical protein